MESILAEKQYWEEFYRTHSDPFPPSPFSQFVLSYLVPGNKLIELGCGNGRDSVLFAQRGLHVLGVDLAETEIQYLTDKHFDSEHLNFLAADFTNLGDIGLFDYVYSRFTLQSINETQEDALCEWLRSHLTANGRIFIEARSVNDPKLSQGERLSPTENFTDNHYRRFTQLDKLRNKLEQLGLEIEFELESAGLSPHPTEDPVLIRLVATHHA